MGDRAVWFGREEKRKSRSHEEKANLPHQEPMTIAAYTEAPLALTSAPGRSPGSAAGSSPIQVRSSGGWIPC